MQVEKFWSILDAARNIDEAVYLAQLEEVCSNLTDEDFLKFKGYLSAYMNVSTECVWLDMACKVINGYVSDDTSLYFGLWVISQGETVLLNALKEPDSLASLARIPFGIADFEMLMGVGFDRMESLDYEAAMKIAEECEAEIEKTIAFKDGKQYGDYEEFEDAMDDIPNVLPLLMKRAEEEGFDWKGFY